MNELDDIRKILADIAVSQAKTDKLLSGLASSQTDRDLLYNERDLQIKETEKQFRETEKQIKITTKIVSGIGVNLGKATELFFYESLADKMSLGEIKFDSIHENVIVRKKRKEAEFDILMYNGDSVAIIETKHNVHEDDVKDLMTTKVENFRSFFPKYAGHKIYLGIGGFAFDKKVQDIAYKHGIAVLKQKGETVKINAHDLKRY